MGKKRSILQNRAILASFLLLGSAGLLKSCESDTNEKDVPCNQVIYQNLDDYSVYPEDDLGLVYDADVEHDAVVKAVRNRAIGYEGFLNTNCSTFFTSKLDFKGEREQYEKVLVLDDKINFAGLSHVIFSDGSVGYVLSSNVTMLPDTYIEVDLSTQKLYMYYEGECIIDTSVVTGYPGFGTIPGTNPGYTEIISKTYDRRLTGDDYDVHVDYFMQFNYDEEGFHDAMWRDNFGGVFYTYNGSHGCVNMTHQDAETMNKYSEIGTKVLVHK